MKNSNNSTQFNLKLPITAKKFEEYVKTALGENFDVIIKRFPTTIEEVVVVFIEGLTNKDLVNRDVIAPLKDADFTGDIKTSINAPFTIEYDMPTILNRILDANVVIYYQKSKEALVLDLKQWDKRTVDTPDSEIEIRGPKESYTESVVTNIALLRRKIKTTNLKIERMVIGRQSATAVFLVYLKDIVNNKVLEELKRRLAKIDVDALFDAGQLEQYLEEKPYSTISSFGMTQKPDITAARILEGRVALMIDGTPHCLTIPELFIENIHATSDYYSRTLYGSYVRLLRLAAFFITILLPGVSIAIMTYSTEMVPFVFLTSFIKATEGTPFPHAAEILFVGIMFEFLKEAGLRMPKAIGAAITIVGALIIGQTAVEASIVSAPTVIVVALTAVTSLATPSLNEFATLYRYFFIALGAFMGLIGIASGLIIMLVQLTEKDSFGIPILSSMSKDEMKDSYVRVPLKDMVYRPISIVKNNIKRKKQNEGNE